MKLNVPSSFDIIGNKEKAVAIIESKKQTKKATIKEMAKAIMQQHRNIKSVLLKKSPRIGVFRTRQYELVAGNKNTEVLHKESGCVFKLDPQKVYFSQREGTERIRVANIISESKQTDAEGVRQRDEAKPKSKTVMVFFSGVGPFCIIIAKRSKISERSPQRTEVLLHTRSMQDLAEQTFCKIRDVEKQKFFEHEAKIKKVIGIEINPDAVKYFKENIHLNKLTNVEALLGDVKEKAKQYYNKCNHVIMPLPESAHEFLEEAIKCLKKKGICHYYCFAQDKITGERSETYDNEREARAKDTIAKQKRKISDVARKLKKKIKFLHVQRVLPWGPRIFKYRIDFGLC